MTQGPDPRAAVRGFMALVLDMVRVDPDRRPSAEMQRWHRELATSIGVVPENPSTNKEMLNGALRLSQILNGPDGSPADERARAEASIQG
jgi:hypothetical protein